MTKIIALACALLVSLTGAALAQDTSDGASPIPPGFASCNARHVPGCEAGVPLPAVTETPAVLATIREVNAQDNAAVTPVEDDAHYGRQDYWAQPNDGMGDCEDIALKKKVDLRNRGIPSRLAVLITREGVGHVVLLVVTDRRTRVLDSITEHASEIRTYAEAADDDYHFITVQDQNGNWQFVGNSNTPVRIAVAEGE